MPSRYTRLDEIPEGDIYFDPPVPYKKGQAIVLTREVFVGISDYTRSQPTAPSPGRVYKKNLHWSGPPSNWFVYICIEDPEDPSATYHIPHEPLVV